ncbi:hypothetical protein SAMN05444266_103119 [Chitinophaga jiangningensis]|uniref:Uncharacterized protein n=1 Tax=Chitinophaga jiangningensis TaxID=1419482 RepID=A0A1M7A451_9BACT|nr:hypothetical protein [Chitinophaga jiangningensis]SHL37522.1 hypothetical protein SAMN05444266_103119 [Chitinophaga jiangningensis]
MESFKLKTFNPKKPSENVAFYCLMKGANAGKPTYKSRDYCYEFICEPDRAVFYYSVVKLMWEVGIYRLYTTGWSFKTISIKYLTCVLESTLVAHQYISDYLGNFYFLQGKPLVDKEKILLHKMFIRLIELEKVT